MKIIIGDYNQISKQIADEFINLVVSKPNAVLGLATGTSPLEIYKNLIEANKEGKVSFKDVTTFNLDEYVGLEGTHDQSYRYFMNHNLFNHLDINKDNTNVLPGVGDYHKAMNEYDGKIAQAGGIDIQLLGLGSDGHIAFNEPGTSFESQTLIVELKEKTRLDNARFFDGDINQVPTHAITMGIKNIMNAKSVLLVASGSNKAQAIKNLMEGPITEDFPASALNNHEGKVIVVADEEACALLSK